MYKLIDFLKENKDKYAWMVFIIIQQICFFFYLKLYILSSENLLVNGTVLIFDLISIIYIYIATHIRKNNDIFLRKIILYVSLICWQHFFILNSNNFYYNFGIILQPFVTYIFTVGSFNLLLHEKIDFKRKIDNFIHIILLVITLSFFTNRSLFNFIYLFLFIGLHIYPFLIVVFYRKYFDSVLSKIRTECFVFSIFLLAVLLLNFIENFVNIELMYSNIGWYIVTITICFITYLRLIQEMFLIKLKNILGKITIILILFSFVLWFMLLFQNIKRIDYLILFLILTELLLFIITMYLKIYFEFNDFENNKFINLLKIEENIKGKFAEYLHDDILQNIIALKNIIQISQIESENKNLIVHELNNLVSSIRNEVDTQKPIIYSYENLKEIYHGMIKSLSQKYKTNKKINFYCTDYLNIYSPYSSIVYRIMKELVNNAIKYSSGSFIDVYLDVKFDNIYIKTNNITESTKIKIGNGLSNIGNKVEFLKGKIDIFIENGTYNLEIVIPMERRICFENIIN
ncbi:hypothetical protein [Streptobacillus moniliformis]|uniref:hypothetical protein n=2 Tax=Streptobacillus moniliformis TaxID=34105 RepID=UPI0007E4C226|nr:hypothetical protein [Streptobacillus moniliformis]